MIKNKTIFWLLFCIILALLFIFIISCQPEIPGVEDLDDMETTTTSVEVPVFQLSDESPPIGYIPVSIQGYKLIEREAVDEDNAKAVFEDDLEKFKFNLDITLFLDRKTAEEEAIKKPAKTYSQDSTITVENHIQVFQGFDKKGTYFQGFVTKFDYSVKIKTEPIKNIKNKEDLKSAGEDFLIIILDALESYKLGSD